MEHIRNYFEKCGLFWTLLTFIAWTQTIETFFKTDKECNTGQKQLKGETITTELELLEAFICFSFSVFAAPIAVQEKLFLSK